MSVPSAITDLSATPASNQPNGDTETPNTIDDHIRRVYAFLAELFGGHVLTGVAGTNAITGASSLTDSGYQIGQVYTFIPANTNTGATTLNISAKGAGAVKLSGNALVGGELVANVPVAVMVTAATPVFEIVGGLITTPKLSDASVTPAKLSQPRTYASSVSASGAAVDFTGIPSWVTRIVVELSSLSTNGAGSASAIVRLGTSSGIDASGYAGSVVVLSSSGVAPSAISVGIIGTLGLVNTNVISGRVVIERLSASSNAWVASANIAGEDAAYVYVVSGRKTLSAVLDRIRITTSNGTDTFDQGTINIYYE